MSAKRDQHATVSAGLAKTPYSREAQQPEVFLTRLSATSIDLLTCANTSRRPRCRQMACKRSGIRLPLAPRFCRSKTSCDLRQLTLSVCNSASCVNWDSCSAASRYSSGAYCTARDRLYDCLRFRTAKLTANRQFGQLILPVRPSPRYHGAPLRSDNMDDLRIGR